jgi:protein-arginine kinase activator protein McsA
MAPKFGHEKSEEMSHNGKMRKRYTAAVKAKIGIELLKEEKTLTQLSSEYRFPPNN